MFVNSFSDAEGGITRAPFPQLEGKWPLEVLNTMTLIEQGWQDDACAARRPDQRDRGGAAACSTACTTPCARVSAARSISSPTIWRRPEAARCPRWFKPRRHPGRLLWAGRIMSGLVVLFLLFDGAIKLIPLDIVITTSQELGIPTHLARTLGVMTLVGTLLYAWPRTSVLGAILLTGYLGGAIYVHVRVGSPLFSPHAVRRLSRPADLGRAVAARRTAALTVSHAARLTAATTRRRLRCSIVGIAALAIALALAGFLIYASTRPDRFRYARTTTINARPEAIFPLINDYRNWPQWSPYEHRDPAMKRTFSGPIARARRDLQVAGQQERRLRPDGDHRHHAEQDHHQARLLRALQGEQHRRIHAGAAAAPATDVTWAMHGPVPFIGKVMASHDRLRQDVRQRFRRPASPA